MAGAGHGISGALPVPHARGLGGLVASAAAEDPAPARVAVGAAVDRMLDGLKGYGDWLSRAAQGPADGSPQPWPADSDRAARRWCTPFAGTDNAGAEEPSRRQFAGLDAVEPTTRGMKFDVEQMAGLRLDREQPAMNSRRCASGHASYCRVGRQATRPAPARQQRRRRPPASVIGPARFVEDPESLRRSTTCGWIDRRGLCAERAVRRISPGLCGELAMRRCVCASCSSTRSSVCRAGGHAHAQRSEQPWRATSGHAPRGARAGCRSCEPGARRRRKRR